MSSAVKMLLGASTGASVTLMVGAGLVWLALCFIIRLVEVIDG